MNLLVLEKTEWVFCIHTRPGMEDLSFTGYDAYRTPSCTLLHGIDMCEIALRHPHMLGIQGSSHMWMIISPV